MELEKLLERGGKRWKGHNKDRVYFDAEKIMENVGFQLTYDITGDKITLAKLKGNVIPNALGMNLKFAFADKSFKLYYDLVNCKWEYTPAKNCGNTVERELWDIVMYYIQSFN